MAGRYYVEAADWLRAVGVEVVEVDDWETRARSSGGFAAPPLGVQWHHTASSGQHPLNDIRYMTETSSARPIGNIYLDPQGVCYLLAAGAANTAGKGGPWTMSRGTVPLDKANTTTWALEVANNGVGQVWPQVQIDAFFKISNELNRRFGNRPDDLFTHAAYAPSRKIDPATAAAVLGPWKPRSINASGTWSVDDVKAEATRRATTTAPTPDEELTEEEVNEILAAIAALQADVDALTTNEANRYKDIVAKVDRNNTAITGLATNESNRYKQYIAWHDEIMGAVT